MKTTGFWETSAMLGRLDRIWPDHRLLSLHRGNQCWDAHDLDHAGHVIGEDVQRHFGGDVFQPLHLEVRGPGSADKAHEFIDSFLSQSTADYIVNARGYGHSNTAAMGSFGEETLTEVGLNDITATQLAQLPMDTSLHEKMIKEFERIKAGF